MDGTIIFQSEIIVGTYLQMTEEFQTCAYIEAGGIFLEFTNFTEPAVAHIKSELWTYGNVCADYAAETNCPVQVDRNFDTLFGCSFIVCFGSVLVVKSRNVYS